MFERVTAGSKDYFNHAKAARTRHAWTWALIAGAFIYRVIGREQLIQQLGVLAWKAVLVCIAVALAHMLRCRLFPYLDVSLSLEEKTQAGATVFLGVALFYAAVILALCAGL
jgi:hypothetical protein